jgi:serine/threonine-protein kinase
MSTPQLLSNRYELGDTLGYGGMSEVHHGHDVRLGREVAIKILRADLARDPQFQERFRREAQNAAALNHPAIVAVYDTGEASTEQGALPYIVMEFVEGRTLRDIVKTEGPMSQKRAMEVMADVCAALDFSHRHGIVHRDVKPANVMITKNGAVKVMDFGIARAMHDGQSAMTQTAAVIGTAQYLSPEQARGEQVDARSDVYAAGCVLYELVTGEPPFTGDSPVAVAYQHVREDPNPPSSVNPAVSPELDAVVLKALAKGPANRYQSSAEMRSDLVRTLSGQRPAAPMVMSEDLRTQVMDSDRRAPQRYDEFDGTPEEDARTKRKRRAAIAAGLVAFGVLIVLLILWLSGAFKNTSNNVAIPKVVGQSVAAAKEALQQNRFDNINPDRKVVCGVQAPAGQQTCTEDQVNKVLAIDPAEGKEVATSTPITLTIGVAPAKVPVPPLTGKSIGEASQALTDVGLTLDSNPTEQNVTDPAQIGKVIDQTPSAGTQLDQGKSVSITIGKTPEGKVPTDCTGLQFDTCKSQLTSQGFTSVVKKDIASEQPKGQVVSQSVTGASVPLNSKITVSVSDGSKIQIDMPNLIGQTQDQAVQTLKNLGWTGNPVIKSDRSGSPQDNGKVSKTDPLAATKINKDQDVTLYIVSNGNGTNTTSPTTSTGGFPGFP